MSRTCSWFKRLIVKILNLIARKCKENVAIAYCRNVARNFKNPQYKLINNKKSLLWLKIFYFLLTIFSRTVLWNNCSLRSASSSIFTYLSINFFGLNVLLTTSVTFFYINNLFTQHAQIFTTDIRCLTLRQKLLLFVTKNKKLLLPLLYKMDHISPLISFYIHIKLKDTINNFSLWLVSY